MRGVRLFVARHGVTPANVARIHAGLGDVRLLPEGRDQFERLAGRLAQIGLEDVWTSPVVRARESAEIVASRCRVMLYEDADLRELEPGPWVGLAETAVRERFARDFEHWQADPASFALQGRETLEEVRVRSVRAIERIRDRGRTVLVVTHLDPIRLLRVHYAGLPLNHFAEFLAGHGQLLELVDRGASAALEAVPDGVSLVACLSGLQTRKMEAWINMPLFST